MNLIYATAIMMGVSIVHGKCVAFIHTVVILSCVHARSSPFIARQFILQAISYEDIPRVGAVPEVIIAPFTTRN